MHENRSSIVLQYPISFDFMNFSIEQNSAYLSVKAVESDNSASNIVLILCAYQILNVFKIQHKSRTHIIASCGKYSLL